MGQITEDILDGSCCDICGIYFSNPKDHHMCYSHGHPAACWDCWDDLSMKEKGEHRRSNVR